jgi:hypothetical protein
MVKKIYNYFLQQLQKPATTVITWTQKGIVFTEAKSGTFFFLLNEYFHSCIRYQVNNIIICMNSTIQPMKSFLPDKSDQWNHCLLMVIQQFLYVVSEVTVCQKFISDLSSTFFVSCSFLFFHHNLTL